MAQGMFDALAALEKGQRQEDVDEQRRLQFMAQDPTRARALSAYEMAGLAGQGLGQAVASFAGRDPRTSAERDLENLRKAKAAMAARGPADLSTVAGVDAYYKDMMQILQQHGLPGEAHAASREWAKERGEFADRAVKEGELKRKTEEGQGKLRVQEEANRIKAARNQQLATQGSPEFIQIVDAIEKQTNPVQRKLMVDRANQLAGGKIVLEDAGDRVIVRNQRGELLGIDEMGEKPGAAKDRLKAEKADAATDSAYKTDMLSLQTTYKAAVDLYNGPGLDNLIGKWSGIAAELGADKGGPMREGAMAMLNPAGQEALAQFLQVRGAVFVKALRDLKAAGKGSTGLGAVSEVEGEKVQSAAAALFPRQQPESFRRKLVNFIDTLEAAAENLADAAQKDQLAPIHLNVVSLTGPSRGKAAPQAPTRPRPTAPSAAPTATPAEGSVTMMNEKGEIRQVRPSKVQEARRRGYHKHPEEHPGGAR